jgi:hypothetical protein
MALHNNSDSRPKPRRANRSPASKKHSSRSTRVPSSVYREVQCGRSQVWSLGSEVISREPRRETRDSRMHRGGERLRRRFERSAAVERLERLEPTLWSSGFQTVLASLAVHRRNSGSTLRFKLAVIISLGLTINYPWLFPWACNPACSKLIQNGTRFAP